MHQRGITIDLIRQKKESINLKMGQLQLSSLESRGKKNEEKETKSDQLVETYRACQPTHNRNPTWKGERGGHKDYVKK